MLELDKTLQEFKSWEFSDILLQLGQFVVWALFILFLAWLASKGINRTVTDNTMRYRARKVARLVSYILIILLAVFNFTGKVKYFSIAIGLITAGLAFALQEVLLSVAGWMAIFGSRIYKPGDRIEINKIKGDVVDVGITKTTLMEIGEWVNSDNYTGRIIQISNAFVFKSDVRNYSTDFPFVWDEINLPISYGSEFQLANQIILEVAKAHLTEYANYSKEHWKQMVKKYLVENAHVEPTLTLSLTESWIEFNLRYVVDYKKRRMTKHQLFTDILKAIDETNGKVALASTTLEVVGMPDMNVRTNDSQ